MLCFVVSIEVSILNWVINVCFFSILDLNFNFFFYNESRINLSMEFPSRRNEIGIKSTCQMIDHVFWWNCTFFFCLSNSNVRMSFKDIMIPFVQNNLYSKTNYFDRKRNISKTKKILWHWLRLAIFELHWSQCIIVEINF